MTKKYEVNFSENLCKGCGLCEEVCPMNIIGFESGKINSSGYIVASITDMDKCIGCASCAIVCPDSVIKIEAE